jgi:hypothetical protein
MNTKRPDPALAVDLAYLGGAIERWAADLAMAEEPAGFLAALDAAAPAAGAAPSPRADRRPAS